MRIRSVFFTVALLLPAVVAGQSLRSAQVVAIPAGVVRTTANAALAQQLLPMSVPSALGDSAVTRKSRILHGAMIGAVVGGVLGAVGGTQLHYDCPTTSDPCHARAQKNEATVALAAAGSVLGFGVGALVSYVSHRRSSRSR